MAAAPARVDAGELTLGVEVGNVPSPSAELQRPEFCYQSHSENTTLTSVYGRPRVTLGLPRGLALEATVGQRDVTLALRAHGTVGRVHGAITCPASALQMADATMPCYGTQPSRDTVYPSMVGGEGALGMRSGAGRVALYAGGRVTWLRPGFHVGFTDAAGNVAATKVEVNLWRGAAFGGVTVRATDAIHLSGEVYSVPQDVTVLRLNIAYKMRGGQQQGSTTVPRRSGVRRPAR